MPTIEPEILRERLENGEDVCVVDIHSEEDYEQGHIEGSQNRPIREALLSGDVEEALAEVDDLPDDEDLVSWFVMQVSPQRRQSVNSKTKAETRVPLMVD